MFRETYVSRSALDQAHGYFPARLSREADSHVTRPVKRSTAKPRDRFSTGCSVVFDRHECYNQGMRTPTVADLENRARNRRAERIAAAEADFEADMASIRRVMELLRAGPVSPTEPDPLSHEIAALQVPPPVQPDSSGSPSLKDICRGLIQAREPGSTFTMTDIFSEIRVRHPDLNVLRPTLSGTLLRLARDDQFMEIVEAGRGTKQSVYRVSARPPDEGAK